MTSALPRPFDELAPEKTSSNGHNPNGKASLLVAVTIDDKGRLELPTVPAYDDTAGLCAWLTAVFNLDSSHPVDGAVREGRRGPDGHVAIHRRNAPPVRFEPASRINAPA